MSREYTYDIWCSINIPFCFRISATSRTKAIEELKRRNRNGFLSTEVISAVESGIGWDDEHIDIDTVELAKS